MGPLKTQEIWGGMGVSNNDEAYSCIYEKTTKCKLGSVLLKFSAK